MLKTILCRPTYLKGLLYAALLLQHSKTESDRHCLAASCEGVDAGVVLCCHLLARAQAASAHHLAAASTEGAALHGTRVRPAAHTVTAGEVAGTLAVVAAVVDLLLDVVHLRITTEQRQHQQQLCSDWIQKNKPPSLSVADDLLQTKLLSTASPHKTAAAADNKL